MKEELLNGIKEKIRELTEEEFKMYVDRFDWGTYTNIPGASGVFFLENGWYTYANDDRCNSTFFGPVKDEELLSFLCRSKFPIHLPEGAMESNRFYEIVHTMYDAALQENIKKKLDEMNNEIRLH